MTRPLLSVALVLLCATLPTPALAQDHAGYLFAYFTGNGEKQEQLFFALSEDAQDWYALNKGRAIVAADSISNSGGIRDPHILRGAKDDGFYIVATDMNTAKNGWVENPGIVLMHSNDLIHWTHARIHLSNDYPERFGDAYWVWAPQTIYDRKAGKYLIYFTLRRTDRKSLITYAAYANADFTGFEAEPTVLFEAKYGSIDNDIIEKDGRFYLFYKGNIKDDNGKETKSGIQVATSKRLWGPYKEDYQFLDVYAGTSTHVEGSSVFPLNDGSGWVLMYDLYGAGRYEYQLSKDLKNFSQEPLSFRKDFTPRHGSVISLTTDELARVQERWGYVLRHELVSNGNPLFRHKHTADPAALVIGDTLWLFAGEDFDGNQKGYNMREWLIFSTTDMQHWTEYPAVLRPSDFSWAAKHPAYAGHVAEKDGKYYWYVSTNTGGIGVAVADHPTGPWHDAIGKPLLTRADCYASKHSWCCIDPAIFIDDDGQAYIFWGNRECYYAPLKDNMTELAGPVRQIDIPSTGDPVPDMGRSAAATHAFTEAPWVHKRNGIYYLTYASEWPEKIAYATSTSIDGPWQVQDVISEIAGNSNTTHPAIVEFRGQWIYISHNGGLPDGSSYSRSLVAEPLRYNADGTIQPIPPTAEGVSKLFGE